MFRVLEGRGNTGPQARENEPAGAHRHTHATPTPPHALAAVVLRLWQSRTLTTRHFVCCAPVFLYPVTIRRLPCPPYCPLLPCSQRPRDLWLHNDTYEGPASALVNMSANCSVGVHDLCGGTGDSCPAYPGFPGVQQPDCTFVDETFTEFVLDTVRGHDAAEPLFLFWAPHIVHSPLQVPKKYLDMFAFINDWRRRR